MVKVVLPADCAGLTDGATHLQVEADTVRRLILALDKLYPGLGDYIDKRMAFAIDGEIHQDAWFSPLAPDSEVVLIPKIGGG